MIILNTSLEAQAFSIIPRKYASAFTLSVRDDNTNVVDVYFISGAIADGNYLTFDVSFLPILVENRYYDLNLYYDYNIWNTNYNLWEEDVEVWNYELRLIESIYKDKIFCTDQVIDESQNEYYKVNKGQYEYYDGFDNIEPLEEGVTEEYTFYDGSSNTYTVR